MLKIVLLVGLSVVLLIGETCGQRIHIIHPTYRPPPQRPIIIRTVRNAPDDEPLWLYKGDDVIRAPATGDHQTLPKYIDDINIDPNRRYARSVDSPSARRTGGSGTRSGSSRDTGATHPGYNRRNAREARIPDNFPLKPFPSTKPRPNPFEPRFPPSPFNPVPRPNYPIYARNTRDIRIPGIRKPTHRDVIIPNWNPNARTKPWQTIGVKKN